MMIRYGGGGNIRKNTLQLTKIEQTEAEFGSMTLSMFNLFYITKMKFRSRLFWASLGQKGCVEHPLYFVKGELEVFACFGTHRIDIERSGMSDFGSGMMCLF